MLQVEGEGDEADNSQSWTSMMMEKAQQDLLDRIEAIPGVEDGMGQLDASLKDVFCAYFGTQVLGAGIEPPAIYCRLLVQVCSIIYNLIGFFKLILA